MIGTSFPIILDEQLCLRPFRISDAAQLVLHANNKKIADNLNDGFPFPYTEKNAFEFFESLRNDFPQKVLAIALDDQVIGAIGIFPQTKVQRLNAEIGYWVGEKYWGRGIATKAVKAMLNYTFANFNLIRIYARPFPDNNASKRVIEKSGFTFEARLKNGLCKNEEIFDELIYSFLKANVQ